MQIISRQHAITQRLSKYFTGKPCKNGHIAARYTKSSVCMECLHPTFTSTDREQRQSIKVVRDAARSQMIRHGYVLHSSDLDSFAAMALFYARLHEPALTPGDLGRMLTSTGLNGFAHYVFWIFPEDRAALLEFETILRANREQAIRDSAALAAAGL